jgi:hypothetical protein
MKGLSTLVSKVGLDREGEVYPRKSTISDDLPAKTIRKEDNRSQESLSQSLTSSESLPQSGTIATTVCNVKVRYLRPQDSNLKEWMARTETNVYIGRAGVVFVDGFRFPPKNSEWANPFKIGKHGNRDAVLRLYREHIESKLIADESFQEKLITLKGKCLGCWCVDTPISNVDEKIVCHGQILLQLISKADSSIPLAGCGTLEAAVRSQQPPVEATQRSAAEVMTE